MKTIIIKNNEIKEPGFLGKTIYVIKGNKICEQGLFGKTVYVIKDNKICEPGLLGSVLFVIKDNKIKKPGLLGETVCVIEEGCFTNTTAVDDDIKKESHSPTADSKQTRKYTNPENEESVEELEKRLEIKTGCVLDFNNCFDKEIYSIPKKYKKITAVAPALKALKEIKIHKDVCVIIGKNIQASEAFTVDEENEHFSSENGILYNKSKTKIIKVPYNYNLSDFKIPSTVNTICEGAFIGCTICELIIPDNIRKISNSAFAYCKKFKQVYIPASVVFMEEDAFAYNARLQIKTAHLDYPDTWHKNIKTNDKEIIWNASN